MKIKEVIVVEGRDDASAIKRAVCAEVITTHGFGIREEIWALIEKAYLEKGILIFTDPDFSGEQIRKKLSERFPKAKHAYLALADAEKSGDVGVENAKPEVIIAALEKAKICLEETANIFTMEHLFDFGLMGASDSSEKRAKVGKILGIGYGNTKSFLNKLNKFGITMEELHEAVLTCNNSGS